MILAIGLKPLLVVLLALPTLLTILLSLNLIRTESAISKWVGFGIGAHLALTVFIAILWFAQGHHLVSFHYGDILVTRSARFPFDLSVDAYGLAYLIVCSFSAFIVSRFSRFYMHREEGYARFFASVCMMVLGLDLICVSSTLDLFFAGWELLGLASFFLIGFYRSREQPADNSLIVFSVYRLGDLALLGSTMIGHIIFWDGDRLGVTFSTPHSHALQIAALLLIVAATCKSAQFPFLNVLPRALEGPTPSSAIFYGSLSVHAGVILLIRTHESWFHFTSARILIFAIGAASALLAPAMGRTLSNLKGQIAYATLAQVGLIFIEVSLGLYKVAMVHVVLNAFLRIHQLLLSPSVVAHGLRVLADRDRQSSQRLLDRIGLRWENSALGQRIYRLSLLDFELPFSTTRVFRMTDAFDSVQIAAAVTVFIVAIASSYRIFESALLATATLLMLRTSDSSKTAIHSWICVSGAFSASVFALFTETHWHHRMLMKVIALYMAVFFAGLFTLSKLPLRSSDAYQGLNRTNPGSIRALFFIFMIFIGTPISPLFFGEDLLLHAAAERGLLPALIMSAVMFFGAITAARIWIRLGHGAISSK